jgi:hypothetical protein
MSLRASIIKNQGVLNTLGPLLLQLSLYSIVLFLDLRLLNWYNDFYTSIQQKSSHGFFLEILTFASITFSQALLLGIISFNSDIYEARLKRFFAERWVSLQGNSNDSPYEKSKLDQRIIDDANLAAEKIAVILPAMIFNVAKAFGFLILLSFYPSKITDVLVGVSYPLLDQYALSIFGALYLVLQILILRMASSWIYKSERIKRSIESRARYRMLSRGLSMDSLKHIVSKYIGAIVKIRFTVGKAHGLNVFTINLLSAASFAVPLIVIFHSYVADVISFGELMKISATYAGFQGAALYVFNFYKDLFRGLAAIDRLNQIER